MTNLTPDQAKHLRRLSRWPFRLWCPPSRYNAIYDGYEAANRRAAAEVAAEAEINRQRSYYEILNRVTTYEGPDYRIRLVGPDGEPQPSLIRAYPQQYEYAEGLERSIGIPEPELLQITA